MERPAVDQAAAAAFLNTRFGDDVSDVVTAPRQGAWSRAYFFRRDGADFVVRFASSSINFLKDRVIGSRATDDLPIPQVIEIGEALGAHYAISERAFGAILEELDAVDMQAALPSLLRALDAIREADVSDSTGYGGWASDGRTTHRSWRDYLLMDPPDPYSASGAVWRSHVADRPQALTEFDDAHAQLPALLDGCPEIRHLVHCDLLYGNVLVADGRISGVFDWGCALVGDFLYDLAWLTFWAPWYEGLGAIDLRSEALRHYEEIGLDVPEFDARLHAYEVHIGLAGQAYQAFTEDWGEFDTTARRVRQLLDS